MTHHRPIVSLENVSKHYNCDAQGQPIPVLRDVNLTVVPGELVILFGPSGSGKSTILNLIAGLERPSGGEVKVSGFDLGKYDSKKLARYHRLKMGMVFQNFNLLKSLPVWENVALPQLADNVKYRSRKKKAMRLLEQFGIAEFAKRLPSELSGGQQQRVAICRALANDPVMLLVDEPTGNLDTKAANEVIGILDDLHRNHGHTIVLVTHNPEHLPIATRVISVRDGAIVSDVAGEAR